MVVELVPATQLVAWRVLEAEQNPRLRLIVDINRQLSDVISITEVKWTPQNILIVSSLYYFLRSFSSMGISFNTDVIFFLDYSPLNLKESLFPYRSTISTLPCIGILEY